MIAEYTVSKDVGSGAIYLADHKGGKPFWLNLIGRYVYNFGCYNLTQDFGDYEKSLASLNYDKASVGPNYCTTGKSYISSPTINNCPYILQ